jgi:hypothetical protein
MKGLLIAMLTGPLIYVAFCFLVYVPVWLMWKRLPDGRIKRLLFRSYGEDHGPWAYEPWQSRNRVNVAEVHAVQPLKPPPPESRP